MAQTEKKDNPNNSFFDGYYKEIWKQVFPPETTSKETDYIIAECNLQKGDHVLDIMCGYGRHALELARREMHVTAVDNLPDYISEIEEASKKEKLFIDCLLDDVLQVKLNRQFDAAICMGNSLQFFDTDDCLKLLRSVSSSLKPGAKLIINTWSIAEIIYKNFRGSSFSKIDNKIFLTESQFLLKPARIEVQSTIISENGIREEKKGVDYIYSLNELESMLNQSGFILKEVYSVPGKKKFTPGEPRAYIVAEKSAL